MTPKDHHVIAEKAFAALNQFSLPEDAPVLIEGTFVFAYHAVNGLFHRDGILSEDEHINSPTHSPLTVEDLPESARPAWQAFIDLQELRRAYVWSPGVPGDELREQLESLWNVFNDALPSA